MNLGQLRQSWDRGLGVRALRANVRARILGENRGFQRLVLDLSWQMRKEEYKIILSCLKKRFSVPETLGDAAS